MKSFKDYVTMNEAKDDFLTPDEIKKLKAHYDGNPGLRSISQSIKDFVADHEAFVELKGNVHKSIKDNMIKTSARLRKLGIEDGALNEKDSEEELDEAKMYKSDYLSDSDVSYIIQAVGVSWRDFEKRVKNAIQKYLEMTLGDVQRITVTRANIGGYMFSQGSTRLLVDEILYEFRLDGESHQGAIKKQEIWVTL